MAIYNMVSDLLFGWTFRFRYWQVQCYSLCCALFLSINNLCVDLCCTHVGMTKHFAYSIDVCTARQLERSIRMAGKVESDRLRKEKQTEED